MFRAPKHDAQTPIVELPFWQWLAAKGKATIRKERKTDLDYVVDYLSEHGFIEGQDTVETDLLDALLLVFKHFWDASPEIAPLKLSAAFTESTHGFYVEGLDYKKRFAVSARITGALAGSGWIYDIEPSTTYFSVINGKVWAKYQQIIGQRCLFEVLPE